MFKLSSAESLSVPAAQLVIAHWRTFANFNAAIIRLRRLTSLFPTQSCFVLPVLAGLVFLLALGWLAWWLPAWPLIGAALGCLCGRAVAIVNGRAGR